MQGDDVEDVQLGDEESPSSVERRFGGGAYADGDEEEEELEEIVVDEDDDGDRTGGADAEDVMETGARVARQRWVGQGHEAARMDDSIGVEAGADEGQEDGALGSRDKARAEGKQQGSGWFW